MCCSLICTITQVAHPNVELDRVIHILVQLLAIGGYQCEVIVWLEGL